MREKLFWEKYRPKTMEDLILLPRIEKAVKGGVKTNLIFYGPFGCGKTSLANILMKDRANLPINASFLTGIDTLRNQVDEFCSKMSMFEVVDDVKIVFLDEIDRVSRQYQDALKGFIEFYEQNVRFIATTNHIDKVQDGVKSRFISIDFNPQNAEEELYLKKEYGKKLSHICKEEGIDLSIDNIKKVINRNFPDMRQMVTVLQHIKETGETDFESTTFNPKLQEELFSHIFESNDSLETYHFLMSNFGADKVGDMMQMLGRPFIEWCGRNNRDLLPKLGDILECVTEYNYKLQTSAIDPIVTACALINSIRNL